MNILVACATGQISDGTPNSCQYPDLIINGTATTAVIIVAAILLLKLLVHYS